MGAYEERYPAEDDDPPPPCTPKSCNNDSSSADKSSADKSMQFMDGPEQHEPSPSAASPGPMPVQSPKTISPSSKPKSPGSTPVQSASEQLSGKQKSSRGNSEGLEPGDQATPTCKPRSNGNDVMNGQRGRKRAMSEPACCQQPTSLCPACHRPRRQKC